MLVALPLDTVTSCEFRAIDYAQRYDGSSREIAVAFPSDWVKSPIENEVSRLLGGRVLVRRSTP